MSNVFLIFLITSVAMSGAVLGLVVPFLVEIKQLRQEFIKRIAEFDLITRQASEANLSHANKLLQLEDKIANFEFWKQSNLQNNFKVK